MLRQLFRTDVASVCGGLPSKSRVPSFALAERVLEVV